MCKFWRPTFAEIDIAAIRQNVKSVVEKVAPAQVMAVVKANGYGHGHVEVAKTAIEGGATSLGVATIEEGVALRKAGIAAPILVFGCFFSDHANRLVQHDLELSVFELNQAEALCRAAVSAKKLLNIHIKVDTGMGRAGIDWRQAVDFAMKISGFVNLNIKGLYTHFACADSKNKDFTLQQIQRFQEVVDGLAAAGLNVPLKHTANSGAILDVPASFFDMVRLGVSMYGCYPSSETSESILLKPAMTLKSRIMALKNIEAGGSIGYNRTFKAKSNTKVAQIPIGYADGYNRKLSNRGVVLIRGKRYPVVGTVSMDQIMVEIGEKSQIEIGDEVVLMGCQEGEEVSVYEISRLLETIPYEVITSISERVPRVYV